MGVSVPMNAGAPKMAPYWDFRYVNTLSNSGQPLPQYANHLPYSGINSTASSSGALAWGTNASVYDSTGSLVQTKCVNGYLAASAMVNGWDAVAVNTFGGPAATWTYQFLGSNGYTGSNTTATPWNADGSGNLMLQGAFIQPFRYTTSSLGGAEVNFNVFLSNKNDLTKNINFVISVYRSNGNLLNKQESINLDTSNAVRFVSTLVKDGTNWVTKSPYSNTATVMTGNTLSSESWPYFYRVNITYANLLNVLNELKKIRGNENGQIYGSKPEDWKLTNVAVQTEITDSYNQSVGSSVRAFEVYLSSGAL